MTAIERIKADAFASAYVDAILFVHGGPAPGQVGNATLQDFSSKALATVEADCAAFREAAGPLLPAAYASPDVSYDEAQAGTDFWFSRNEMEIGFQDAGLGRVGAGLMSLCGAGTLFPPLTVERKAKVSFGDA